MFWHLIFMISAVYCSSQVCPDKSSTCTDSSTCCQLADKTYGCCPIENAVCCDDHIHCCPPNTKCSVGMCIQLDSINTTSLKIRTNYVKCSGTEFVCPDGDTCCKGNIPGTFGCCPLSHAVCCKDGNHCCPKDTECDLKTETCISKNYITKMYDSQKNKFNAYKYATLLPVTKSNLTNVICPGESFQCPDGYTCCQLPDDTWGCCPFAKATCCKDHLHCCPESMKCDSSSKSCSQGLTTVPSIRNKMAEPVNASIICPDKTSCSEFMTCCMISEKSYGCCPYPDAVCCSDGKHCCPSDYICDVEQKQCVPSQKKLRPNFSKLYKKSE